jgi:hypothetical protein
MFQIRQGDVLISKCNKIPDGMTPVQPKAGRLILAEGEATGHHHSVDCMAAQLFAKGNQMVMIVGEPTTIQHQEHGAIEIAPGQYWVTRQREYTPAEIVRVRD